MTRDEFVETLGPLVLAMRADFDKPTWTAYYQALENIPAPLFREAVATAMQQDREFFPKANELRALAERARQTFIAAHPYEGCWECEHSKGWRPTLVDGVARVERCPCLEQHRMKLAALGVVTEPLALPAAREPELAITNWYGE